MEPEGSLPHLQVSATCPYPEPDWFSPRPTSCKSILILSSHLHLGPRPYQRISPELRHLFIFHDYAIFYGEELLAPCPTSKLEDQPLLAVCDCLFNCNEC